MPVRLFADQFRGCDAVSRAHDIEGSPPFASIVCAVDGSRGAESAIEQALTLAAPDAQLMFLARAGLGGVARPPQALEPAIRLAVAAGMSTETLIRRADEVAGAILHVAGDHDLLVLGASGEDRRAGHRLGRVAIAALRHAPVPVLLARPERAGTVFPRDILLATDGSPAMRSAIDVTAALARRHDARVLLLHADHSGRAVRHELAEETVRLLEATGHEPVVVQLGGRPPERIAELAAELPVSLIVMGSRMLTGLRALGSVSARAGMTAPCSVLVVRGST